MAKYIAHGGAIIEAPISQDIHKEARDAGMSVEHLLNQRHADADPSYGPAFQQILASEGLGLPGEKNPFGLRPATIGDILEGKASAGLNTAQQGTPFGTASRTLFPPAVILYVESQLLKDRKTDTVIFDEMVGADISIDKENFEQPILDYTVPGGPQSAMAQRITQNAQPGVILQFSTSDRLRRMPTYSYGMEFSDQALQATTLPIMAMMVARFMQVDKDQRVYNYLSNLFMGDADLNTGAVPAVTTLSLDSTCPTGKITQTAWVRFLARNRKYRTIDFVCGTIGTYLAVEGRLNRPGTTAYDPTLARIDPQAVVVNNGFGNNVKWFIVDDYAAGGPIPEGQVWALDSRYAITRVTNINASYAATELFVLKRSTALRFDYGETCYRQYGNTDLRAFDILTIS